jgi:pimeloyl-ACP methyl ester carboxylesterase
MLRTLLTFACMTAAQWLPAQPRSELEPETALQRRGRTSLLTASAVDQATEPRLLDALDRDVLIVPHRGIHAERPPVLLVHGLNGAPRDLADVADRLDQAGRQVLLVLYRDRERTTSESGTALADAMVRLREEHYPEGTPLDIVAHSMGGIVARAALNTLQDPDWRGGGGRHRAPTPRAGFGPIRLRAIDTPWDGFAQEPRVALPLLPLMRMVFGAFGWAGAWEMRANSKTLQRLFDPILEQVDIRTFSVKKHRPGTLRSLPEIEVCERRALVRFVLEGTLPETPRLRNAARSLAQDSRFGEFQGQLREAFASCSRCDRAEQFSRSYDEVMPRPVGSHTSILVDGRFVNALVADLAVPTASDQPDRRWAARAGYGSQTLSRGPSTGTGARAAPASASAPLRVP